MRFVMNSYPRVIRIPKLGEATRLLFLMILVPCAAHAAVITHVVNVDFDNLGAPSGYNGQGAVPAAGNLWTHTSAASLAALPDSLGGATGVGFTRTNFTNFGSIGPTNSLLQDYAFSVVPGGFSLTMNGLDPSTVYDLILYGAQDGFGGRGTLWTVTDDTGVLPSQLTDASDFSGTGFVLGSTYTIFSNLVPTAGGNLFVSGAQEAANGVSFLNGFQTRWNTTTVPEPGTIVSLFTTLLVGFAALWRTRAREPITN